MTAQTAIALSALLTSISALGASIYFGWCTRDHNRRSVKPLPYVSPNDYENMLAVRLWNYGSGPLIMNSVVSSHALKGLSGHLIDLVPSEPESGSFDAFVKVHAGRAIPPGECLDLIQVSIDDSDTKMLAYRDELRAFLGNISVVVDYTDIYGRPFDPYYRELDWFHRDRV